MISATIAIPIPIVLTTILARRWAVTVTALGRPLIALSRRRSRSLPGRMNKRSRWTGLGWLLGGSRS